MLKLFLAKTVYLHSWGGAKPGNGRFRPNAEGCGLPNSLTETVKIAASLPLVLRLLEKTDCCGLGRFPISEAISHFLNSSRGGGGNRKSFAAISDFHLYFLCNVRWDYCMHVTLLLWHNTVQSNVTFRWCLMHVQGLVKKRLREHRGGRWVCPEVAIENISDQVTAHLRNMRNSINKTNKIRRTD